MQVWLPIRDRHKSDKEVGREKEVSGRERKEGETEWQGWEAKGREKRMGNNGGRRRDEPDHHDRDGWQTEG